VCGAGRDAPGAELRPDVGRMSSVPPGARSRAERLPARFPPLPLQEDAASVGRVGRATPPRSVALRASERRVIAPMLRGARPHARRVRARRRPRPRVLVPEMGRTFPPDALPAAGRVDIVTTSHSVLVAPPDGAIEPRDGRTSRTHEASA